VHLQPRNLPRIVLLDCADEVVTSLAANGYDLAVGYTGYFAEHPTMDIPPALHEKDLLVVDLDPGWQPRPINKVMPTESRGMHAPPPRADHAREPRLDGKPLEGFEHSLKRGAIIVCLLEGITPPPPVGEGPLRGGSFQWLPVEQPVSAMLGRGGGLNTSGVANDHYLHVPDGLAQKLPQLAQLLSRPSQAVTSLRTLVGVEPVLLNEKGEAKAGVFHSRNGGSLFLLPYFARKPAALHRLIGTVLPGLNPELFPAREKEWSDEDAYQMPQVVRVREQRKQLQAEHEQALERLASEEATATVQQRPFTALLSAYGEDLHPVVRDVLAWLGFEVTDHDANQKAAKARLEEDLQVKDGSYFAVVEVTSSRGNAKDKDFMDLEKYRTWRSKTPGRDDIDPTDIRGLLIVNQMHREEPARREPLYASSGNVDWPQHAAETGITILSTWELFKVVMAVEAGDQSKAQARAKLQEPGLLTLPM
jgi:hypothetical protein